jgi:hypothetical protein
MASPAPLQRWLLACGLTALALLAVTSALLIRQEAAGTPAPLPTQPGPTADCGIPALTSLRALPGAEDPPVLLWAEGDVRLYLDDRAAFSSPEAPRHLPTGEHTVRLEAPGRSPLLVRVRFDAWAPALLHAALDPVGGLTLVRLNAPCVDCPAALQPYDTLAQRPAGQPVDALLSGAAQALRDNAWPEALALLEQVPEAQRRSGLFLRLASQIQVDTASTEAARRSLASIPARQGGGLPALLARLGELEQQESKRRRDVQLARWNRATERFGALVARHGSELPQAVGSASQRLEALSPTFERALEVGDELDAEETLRAAEAELLQLATRLRAARPADCAFQAEIVATASR